MEINTYCKVKYMMKIMQRTGWKINGFRIYFFNC